MATKRDKHNNIVKEDGVYAPTSISKLKREYIEDNVGGPDWTIKYGQKLKKAMLRRTGSASYGLDV